MGRDLLAHCFAEHGSFLPVTLRDWLLDLGQPATVRAPLEAELKEGRQILFRACETGDSGWLIAAQASDDSPVRFSGRFGLTPREANVLHWIRRGKSKPEIGAILEMSSRTVDKHMERVLRRWGVDSRSAATVMTSGS